VLRAYTINAAYALEQNHFVGSLAMGKRADITIINRNLFDTSVKNIDKTTISMTIIEGNIFLKRR
jgi:predicted amidohydrolase YtcJ|tara:strand:- start:3269 stop:3463 length:195 start_codon:yes stop_codon:yes gene_type:complete